MSFQSTHSRHISEAIHILWLGDCPSVLGVQQLPSEHNLNRGFRLQRSVLMGRAREQVADEVSMESTQNQMGVSPFLKSSSQTSLESFEMGKDILSLWTGHPSRKKPFLCNHGIFSPDLSSIVSLLLPQVQVDSTHRKAHSNGKRQQQTPTSPGHLTWASSCHPYSLPFQGQDRGSLESQFEPE